MGSKVSFWFIVLLVKMLLPEFDNILIWASPRVNFESSTSCSSDMHGSICLQYPGVLKKKKMEAVNHTH